ncbi:MAG: hypothetical protein GDA49_12485 [Rhodospirillales bacterium]|nr:hypothetical protein [Rhodospirillales bacterium]
MAFQGTRAQDILEGTWYDAPVCRGFVVDHAGSRVFSVEATEADEARREVVGVAGVVGIVEAG